MKNLRESKKVRIRQDSAQDMSSMNEIYMSRAIEFADASTLRRRKRGGKETHYSLKRQDVANGDTEGGERTTTDQDKKEKNDKRRAVLPVMTNLEKVADEMKQKSEKTKKMLLRSLKNSRSLAHLLFHDLEQIDIEKIVEEMFRVVVEPNQDVITQGDVGHYFYVVEEGKFDLLRYEDSDDENNQEKKVERIATKPAGSFFGELALLYEQTAAFTVKARDETCVLWALSRHQFHEITIASASRQQNQKLQYLKGVSLFESVLELREIATLADAMEYHVYKKDETILKPGLHLMKILFVGEGIIEMYAPGTKGEKDPVAKLFEGETFGELALVQRFVTEFELVAGTERTTVLILDIAEFEGLLGSLKEYVKRRWAQAGSFINEEKAQTIISTLIQDKEPRITGTVQQKQPSTAEDVVTKEEIEETLNVEKRETKPGSTILPPDNQWEESPALLPNLEFEDLEPLKTLGQGSFGKVYLVRNLRPNQNQYIVDTADALAPTYFALKIIARDFIVENGWEEKADNEQLGGDLYEFMMAQERFLFPENVVQFYLGCVVCGIEVFHKRSIVYRDLKPENLLLNDKGYVKIADLGLAKKTLRTYTVCGTPDYMAPEVLTGKGHDFACDWWATGVLCYEMLVGQTPFFGKTVNEIYENILGHTEIDFIEEMELSSEARQLISSLLQPKKTKRLGNLYDGVDGIKKHSFFDGFNWKDLMNESITPPMMPDSILDFSRIFKENFTHFTCFDDRETPDDWSPWKPAVETMLSETPKWDVFG